MPNLESNVDNADDEVKDMQKPLTIITKKVQNLTRGNSKNNQEKKFSSK